jgi:hypothetical protein
VSYSLEKPRDGAATDFKFGDGGAILGVLETVAPMPTKTHSSPSSTRVPVKNPVTQQWVKLDTKTGRIVDSKKSPGPYKGIPKK